MIGLYKSIRDFRGDKLTSFKAFAELCITRQIITAIKTATRQKHIPLNSYVSLDKPIYDEDSDRTLLDVISGTKVTDLSFWLKAKLTTAMPAKKSWMLSVESSWHAVKRHVFWKNTVMLQKNSVFNMKPKDASRPSTLSLQKTVNT